MPAPTFTKTQLVPECGRGSGAINETDFDRGNVVVNTSSCCRTYGKSVSLTGLPGNRSLLIEGSVPTCSNTSAGAKTFSGDSFRLCGGSAIRGTHSGSGTISGASFSGSASGTATGIVSGAYTVSISGTFTSPGNGSFTGTVSGVLVGTVSGTIAGGVVTSVTYTFTSPAGTGTGTNNTLVVGGGGTTFTFSGRISGVTSNVNAYWTLTWTNCSVEGIVAQLFDASDDSLIVEYTNKTYCVLAGLSTMLNRVDVECSHPCMDVGLTQKQSFALHPLTICFVPSVTMAQCRGGNRSTQYTLTAGGATHVIAQALDGLSTTSGGEFNHVVNGTDTPPTFSLTNGANTVTVTPSAGGTSRYSLEGTACDATNPFTTLGRVSYDGFSGTYSVNGGAAVPFTNGSVAYPGVGTGTFAGGLLTPAQSTWTNHDFCSGDIDNVQHSQIAFYATTGGGPVGFIGTAFETVDLNITHNGISYPVS